MAARTYYRDTLTRLGVLAVLACAAADTAARIRTALAVDALLARLAASAIANLTGKAATETLVRVRAFRVLVATGFAARLTIRAARLIVDARVALLAADACAYDLRWRATNDTIFADLARLATSAVTNVLPLRTAEAGGVNARIGRLAAMLVSAPYESL